MADDETSTGGQGARFGVTVDEAAGRPRLAIRGEVDVYTSPELRRAFEDLLAERGSVTVEVDLSALDFIDSTGLGVLVGALKRSRAEGGEMVLRGPQPSI